LLETAFFGQRNLLIPWQPVHATLVPLFFVMHAAVAAVALAAAHVAVRWFRLPRAFVFFAPVAVLVGIHGLSHYRERVNLLPRDLAGTLITLTLFLAPIALAWVFAKIWRDREGVARSVATVMASVLVLTGIVRVATVQPVGGRAEVRPRGEEETIQAVDTPHRVLLFGFDGASWEVMDPLIEQGRLPNIAALARRGRTFDVETLRPTFSPVIWTSIATGKDRFQHAIHDVVQTRLPGGTLLPRSIMRTGFYTKTTGTPFRYLSARNAFKLTPYRSSQITATSVFEVASEAGLSTSLVEWYVSWPTRPLTGVVVSDRFHLQKPSSPSSDTVSPGALATILAPHIVKAENVSSEQVLSLVDTDGLDDAEVQEWLAEHALFRDEMRYNLARDLTTRNVAVDLLARDREWRLFGLYFRAVDLSHHLTWPYRGDSGAKEPRLQPVIDRYHEFMDGIVGEVLAQVPDDVIVIFLSDHGYETGYGHARAPDGVGIIAGGVTIPSEERGRISVYEVAPTIAVLLGLPIAEDLAGGPRLDSFPPGTVPTPWATIGTWERARHLGPGVDDEPDGVDDDEIDRLRALGYIQ
jgi:predicted AlkP superfamily phosphohydrolase/phosphomutase